MPETRTHMRKTTGTAASIEHRAWDRSVQVDSFTEAREIFPNMVRAQSIVCRDMHDDAPAEEDALAAWEGASFVEPDGDQDWLEWISKYVEDD